MKADLKNALDKIKLKLSEHKYVALILLVGLILLLLPTSTEKSTDPPATQPEATAPDAADAERRLEEILSLIDGAGQVRVLLTLKSDGERVLARETEQSAETDGGGSRQECRDSALVVEKGSGQSGEVEVKYLYPEYRGAVVAAEGAGSATVRAELLEAVKAATGLGATDIKIVKMR